VKYGVPASAGERHTNTMNTRISSALDMMDAPPAKAGTPNFFAPYGVPASAGEGMKELEGMLK